MVTWLEIITEKKIVLDPERDLVVFENPSHAELLKLLDQFGELRGSSGPNQPLYVWDAHAWVHHTIAKYIGQGTLPYYLYFSKTRVVHAEEWQKMMKRAGSIYVGVKYSIVGDNNKEVARPDIPLSHPVIQRAIGPTVRPDAKATLAEAFGAPIKWQVTKQTDTHFETKFKIDKVFYEVSLFRYDRKNDGWELSFTAATKTEHYGFAASGTGNAWTVLGTVVDIARKFIALKQPKIMKIESDITERSRVAVNLRIARAIAKDLPYAIEDEQYHIFIQRTQ